MHRYASVRTFCRARAASLTGLLGRFWRDRCGNYSMIVVLLLPVLTGFVGVGTEMGLWLYDHQSQQTAADSAAFSAATYYKSQSPVGTGDTTSGPNGQAQALAVAASYGFPGTAACASENGVRTCLAPAELQRRRARDRRGLRRGEQSAAVGHAGRQRGRIRGDHRPIAAAAFLEGADEQSGGDQGAHRRRRQQPEPIDPDPDAGALHRHRLRLHQSGERDEPRRFGELHRLGEFDPQRLQPRSRRYRRRRLELERQRRGQRHGHISCQFERAIFRRAARRATRPIRARRIAAR